MSAFLLKLLELSLQAGVLTLGILLVRLVFRKLPAKYLCLLWAIVAVRLVVPFSFETGFALAPNLQKLWSEEENKYKEIYTEFIPIGNVRVDSEGNGINGVPGTESDGEVDYYLGSSQENSGNATDIYGELIGEMVITTMPEDSSNATFRLDWRELFHSVTPVLFVLWLLGMVILLGYGAFSCFRVKRLVKNAMPYEDNIWLCEGLQTPFLFGWRNPQIYLPTNMEEAQIQYVVEHEKAHIARGDNYTKIIGYVLLSVYWFNPLIWVAYVIFCKDVERACDERVISGFSPEDRKGYAEALLECSVDRKFGISNPLAFGEMDVKKRITGILKYKKPGRWLIVIAMLLCMAAVAGCFFVKENVPAPTAEPTPTVAPTNPPRGDGPNTPVPTVGPSSEQRGDGPYTPTPTPAATKITPTPLPPSDLTLLGQIAPGTVLAVPVGQSVEVDLDGDGVLEKITFGMEGYEKGVSYEEARKNIGYYGFQNGFGDLFFLKVDDQIFLQGENWGDDNPGFTTYYIFDIDLEDKFKEIGLYSYGPNGNSLISLYRYEDGKLYTTGGFCSAPLESDYPWKSDDFEDVPYMQMVQEVNREKYLITLPGDGTILCEEGIDILETSSVVRKYKLRYSDYVGTKLDEVIRERYEFPNWNYDNGEFNCRAAREFTAYFSPVDMNLEERKDTVTVTIPEGTRVSFYAYYPDNGWTAGWVQFAYGENLENFAWFYKGVDATGHFMIYLPDETEKSRMNLFNNLNMAG